MDINNVTSRGRGSSGLSSLLVLVLNIWILVACCRSTSGATCEQIRIPMCRSMPYNVTQIPNLLHHSNQLNALLVLEQYQPLVATNCSGVLLFFLCALFTPVCPINFSQEVIPPCQDVCLRARKGCEPVLAEYNVTWPADLSCDDLPPYETGVCISPEAINSSPIKKGRMILKRKAKTFTDAPKGKQKRRREDKKDCSFSSLLLNRNPFAGKTHPMAPNALSSSSTSSSSSSSSLLIVRATLLKVELHSKGKINFTFLIKDVFRSPSPMNLTVNDTMNVQPSSGLHARNLRQCGGGGRKYLESYRPNRDYLVVAEVDAARETARIACSRQCVVQPWKKSLQKTVQKWNGDRRKMKSIQNSPKNSKSPNRKSRRKKDPEQVGRIMLEH